MAIGIVNCMIYADQQPNGPSATCLPDTGHLGKSGKSAVGWATSRTLMFGPLRHEPRPAEARSDLARGATDFSALALGNSFVVAMYFAGQTYQLADVTPLTTIFRCQARNSSDRNLSIGACML